MLKFTAPNGEIVELNPSTIVEIYNNDGEYDSRAKTVLKLVNGVQAVVEDKETVEKMVNG
jgi:uncharacterized protein YlzI (FlbEa/FlbD family)